MITCKLVGGLGNQLFQIANCIAYSIRYNESYQIPQDLGDYGKYGIYFRHLPRLTQKFEDFGYMREPTFRYQEIPKKEQICFMGYYQSWKYFWDVREQVFDLIRPGFGLMESVDYSKVEFLGLVSVHVRRGDYVEYKDIHPPVGMEYLKKAIGHFFDLGYYRYTVYSDDIQWCKDNMDPGEIGEGVSFNFMDTSLGDPIKDALFDMYTMSRHEHQIISNSTFSLWAAFLNQNPDKIVVAPSNRNWFGPGAASEYSAEDIMPDDYVRISY